MSNIQERTNFKPICQSDVEKPSQKQFSQRDVALAMHALTGTHFSILKVIFDILKLQITSREQEIFTRREERNAQILHKTEEAKSLKAEGKWLMSSGITAGIIGITSGFIPIAFHMKGETIMKKLGGVFTSLSDMPADRFGKSLSKMTQQMSDMSKSSGQIYSTFAQGSRTTSQLQADLNRDYASERTQSMQDIEDRRKEHERFCHEILQMLHETARQIYTR